MACDWLVPSLVWLASAEIDWGSLICGGFLINCNALCGRPVGIPPTLKGHWPLAQPQRQEVCLQWALYNEIVNESSCGNVCSTAEIIIAAAVVWPFHVLSSETHVLWVSRLSAAKLFGPWNRLDRGDVTRYSDHLPTQIIPCNHITAQ